MKYLALGTSALALTVGQTAMAQTALTVAHGFSPTHVIAAEASIRGCPA